MTQIHNPPAPDRFPNRWALFPIGLLGILVSVQAVLFSLSRNDPSFAVEPEYYQKAVNWDQHAEQRAVNAKLGWKASVQLLTTGAEPVLRIELFDGEDKPLTGATLGVTAFPNARATAIQTTTSREGAPGIYEAPLRVVLAGEWEIRITARRGNDTFTHTARVTTTGAE